MLSVCSAILVSLKWNVVVCDESLGYLFYLGFGLVEIEIPYVDDQFGFFELEVFFSNIVQVGFDLEYNLLFRVPFLYEKFDEFSDSHGYAPGFERFGLTPARSMIDSIRRESAWVTAGVN
jgi:hypothetical protein